MNYRGSYRNLLKNSEAAMLSSIEIYNKPQFKYRDECFVILLLNSWELLLKSIISKNGNSIFYRKKKREPYRTFSLNDSFNIAEKYFPKDVPAFPIQKNIDLLATYRDNAVHFYNERGFGAVVYSLAQTNIKNYKDLIDGIFTRDFSSGISWSLLPLSFRSVIDPVAYISGKGGLPSKKINSAAGQFMAELRNILDELEKNKIETDRFLTIFNVKLESVKKISKADVTIGVGEGGSGNISGPLSIIRTVDPNISHPLKRKQVLAKTPILKELKFTSYVFEAIAWRFKVKENKNLCWQDSNKALTKYSNEIYKFLNDLTKKEIQEANLSYKKR